MRIRIVAVGKLKERALREVLDDYLGRLRRYVPVEELELRGPEGFERALSAGERVVALEVTGEALTSRGLASRVAAWSEVGKGEVSFLIGGAQGLPEAVSRAAHHQLSLSTLTLPHRLARVLLAEQLYRAFTILRGEPYAREG